MSDETVIPFSGTFKTTAERHADELHDFLIDYVRSMTGGKNVCAACGKNKWQPYSHIFPTYFVRSSGLVHLDPIPFLLVRCGCCGNMLFFAYDAVFKNKYEAFEESFKARHIPKEIKE